MAREHRCRRTQRQGPIVVVHGEPVPPLQSVAHQLRLCRAIKPLLGRVSDAFDQLSTGVVDLDSGVATEAT